MFVDELLVQGVSTSWRRKLEVLKKNPAPNPLSHF
jgi:hypothetical protein